MTFGSRRRVWLAAFAVAVLLILLSSIVMANVDETWEWAEDHNTDQPRRNLRIFCGDGVDEQWEEWLDEAIANWEGTGSGWTFEKVDEKQNSEITFSVGDVDEEDTLGYFDPQFDSSTGELIGGNLVMNEDVDWDTSGDDAYDPVHVIKHELGHAMRLDHSDDGQVMPSELGAGEHDPTPNEDDIQEAKDAAEYSVEEPAPPEETPDGRVRLTAGDASLILDPSDYMGPHMVMRVMDGILMPWPLRVPAGMERIVAAVGVFPPMLEFTHPAELLIKIDPGAVSGLELVGETHGLPLPPVTLEGMIPVQYVFDATLTTGGEWVPGGGKLMEVDAGTGCVRLQIPGGGVYGLAAPKLQRAEADYERAFPDLPSGVVGDSLVELRALDVYRGYPDGTCGPNRNLTRLEFATIAVRLGDAEGLAEELEDEEPDFEDQIPAWGWGYLNAAAELGLVQGYPDHTFQPQNDVKASEAVAILLRLLGGFEDATARKGAWPAGYVSAADQLKLFEALKDLVSDITGWANSAISRGEMGVLTCSALWIELRHDEAGEVGAAPSFLEGKGWWRQEVTLASVTDDGRRWVLRQVATAPELGLVTRLDTGETVYRGSAAGVGGVEEGDSFTAMMQGSTVQAIH